MRVYLEEEPLTESQQRELEQALTEADAGEGTDGWQFLAELNGAAAPSPPR